MTKEELKASVIQIIDEHRGILDQIRDDLYQNPEYGYKEIQATSAVSRILSDQLGLQVTEHIAITGCRADSKSQRQGPRIAVMGELDGITCPGHRDATKTGASHTCGHNLQIAGMVGTAMGLVKSGVLDLLDGQVCFIAAPAEEFIELEYRETLKNTGKISFFGGKQELIANGQLDDVDMAMMFHSLDLGDQKALIGPKSNGFIGKKIRFIGKAAHAGSAPYDGINALNAAMLAINNVNALRETFRESERVRFHPIITKGGDIVNVVPAEVTMEAYVRARTLNGITQANDSINRAIKAGAAAIGADAQITEIPGYLPILRQPSMDYLMRQNLETLGLEGQIVDGGDFTGSFDFGDVSHIMPALHPMIGGITGALHTRDFRLTDSNLAYIIPAKAMAMTIIDLLFDGAAAAREILADFKPTMTKQEYLAYQKRHDRTL